MRAKNIHKARTDWTDLWSLLERTGGDGDTAISRSGHPSYQQLQTQLRTNTQNGQHFIPIKNFHQLTVTY